MALPHRLDKRQAASQRGDRRREAGAGEHHHRDPRPAAGDENGDEESDDDDGDAAAAPRPVSGDHDKADTYDLRLPFTLAAETEYRLTLAAGLWWRYIPTRYQTGIGERRVVALADGSSVSLDAASEVDVRYLDGRRRLWLRKGRAMFTVAKDPLRPFSVEAGDRMVVATGTRFSVEKLKGEVRVVLFEGHVAVTGPREGGKPAAPIRLRDGAGPADEQLVPGREMVVAEAAPLAQVATVDPAQAAGWEAGLLQFSDQPLALAVQQMDRYSPIRLTVGDAAAAAIPISGQFRSGDTDAFVEGVTAVFPVTAEKKDDGEIVFHHKFAASSPAHREKNRRST